MAVRDGMSNLIDRVRRMANAGTAQYTVGGVTYWTDQHVQDTLDLHSSWVVNHPLVWQSQQIDGTVNYLTALSDYKNLEANTSGTSRFAIRNSLGTLEGTANYTPDYDNGRITWSTNTGGTSLYLTGYSYDVYGAAIELLEDKMAYVDLWYDFRADNQAFSRSQVVKSIESLIKRYQRLSGQNLPSFSGDVHSSVFYRVDINERS